jgi:CheY-like chemotaxis protein
MYLEIAAKLGARRALPKPFTPQELLQAIDEVLAEPPPQRPI